jgi:glycosyltransferase involved in cell wall biosynthesis
LRTRHTIDHERLEHKYSATLARKIWCDLQDELFAMQQALRASGKRDRLPLGGRKVSVCIPFFNHHRYLARLVEAFSNQRYQDLEMILVNDGSSAEAGCEFNRIAAETSDARFRFLTTENRGPGSARNFAAEQANGELLVFFDADNVPKSNEFIGILVHALQESGADCVTCAYDIVAEDRDLPGEADVIATYRPIGPCLETGFLQNNLGDTTMIIHRTVARKVGGWSDNRAFTWEDHAFLLNLCFSGFKLETLPDPLFYYRQGGRNQGAGNVYLNYETLFRLLQNAPAADLARIIGTVAGPALLRGNLELTTKVVGH